VYFMDNEDFFKRKAVFRDEKGNFFDDNAERLIFFCKSALEIVKKFGWPPDIIQCHGWLTTLITFFLKTAYKKEPVFASSQTIFTAQNDQFKEALPENFIKMVTNSVAVTEKDLEAYNKNNNAALNMGAAKFADVLIHGEPGLSKELMSFKLGRYKRIVPFTDE